jgi:hypothetical protein
MLFNFFIIIFCFIFVSSQPVPTVLPQLTQQQYYKYNYNDQFYKYSQNNYIYTFLRINFMHYLFNNQLFSHTLTIS